MSYRLSLCEIHRPSECSPPPRPTAKGIVDLSSIPLTPTGLTWKEIWNALREHGYQGSYPQFCKTCRRLFGVTGAPKSQWAK